MYVHAYQSYVWNSVVSRRVREFGLVPRAGDLAFRGAVNNDDDDDNHSGMICTAAVVLFYSTAEALVIQIQ